ncbi:hypothetical protein EBO15_18305 [Actinomadura harenae]|uniref:Uncharacterized protein n=1 Tax=Actinomadura harenae TaxID=2483351 RepID=A0A3M2LZA0_9ACTN|nr:hypothetical protein EBO15_18305 [Actinomadura harenae]
MLPDRDAASSERASRSRWSVHRSAISAQHTAATVSTSAGPPSVTGSLGPAPDVAVRPTVSSGAGSASAEADVTAASSPRASA